MTEAERELLLVVAEAVAALMNREGYTLFRRDGRPPVDGYGWAIQLRTLIDAEKAERGIEQQ